MLREIEEIKSVCMHERVKVSVYILIQYSWPNKLKEGTIICGNSSKSLSGWKWDSRTYVTKRSAEGLLLLEGAALLALEASAHPVGYEAH